VSTTVSIKGLIIEESVDQATAKRSPSAETETVVGAIEPATTEAVELFDSSPPAPSAKVPVTVQLISVSGVP